MRASCIMLGIFVLASACGRFGEAPSVEPDASTTRPTPVPSSDGSSDAPAPGPFCATQSGAFRCFDFDTSDPVELGWTNTRGLGNVMKRDGSSFVSAPSSLLAESTNDADVGYFELVGVPGNDRVRLDLFVRLEVRGPGVTQLLELTQEDRSLIIYLEPDDVYLKEFRNSPAVEKFDTLPTAAFSASSFTHLVVELALAERRTRVFVDDGLVVDRALVATAWNTMNDVTVTIGPGQIFGGQNTLRRERFDNVVIHTK